MQGFYTLVIRNLNNSDYDFFKSENCHDFATNFMSLFEKSAFYHSKKILQKLNFAGLISF